MKTLYIFAIALVLLGCSNQEEAIWIEREEQCNTLATAIIIRKDTVIHCGRCKLKIAKTKKDITPLTIIGNNSLITYNHQYKSGEPFYCYNCGYSVMRSLKAYDIRGAL